MVKLCLLLATTNHFYFYKNGLMQDIPKLEKPINYTISLTKIKEKRENSLNIDELFISDLSYREWHQNLLPYGLKIYNYVY